MPSRANPNILSLRSLTEITRAPWNGRPNGKPIGWAGAIALGAWLALVAGPLAAIRGQEREEPRLLGHWPLIRDTSDLSPHKLETTAHQVTLGAPGRGDAAAAKFDGKRSALVIGSGKLPAFGSAPFTLSLWVNSPKGSDTVGDLISKYDPVTRRGFNLTVRTAAGVTSSQANVRQLHFGIDQGTDAGQWLDHGRLGEAVLIYSMAVFQGRLYAGTCVAGEQEAGRVFSFDGSQWTDCGNPDQCNSVSSLAVYQGKLYVGTGKYRLRGSSLAESENPSLGGGVYRYEGADKWAPVGRLPGVEAINGMVVYRGKLYASSMYAPAAFFRYDGGTRWTALPVPGGDAPKRVESLTVFGDHLYATGYDEGAVYRFDGSTWESLGVLPGASQTYGFAIYRGNLYVSEWPNAKVFRWQEGQGWLAAGRLGDELETMPLMVYNGKMYAGTLPTANVFRFDEPSWTKIARLDRTPDVRYRRVWSMAVFQGRLMAGTLPSGHVHSVEVGRNVTWDRELPEGWVHIAAVRDKSQLRLYVDGRLVGNSKPIAPGAFNLDNAAPLRIGFGSHDYFSGSLSDVRILRGALPESEIRVLAERAPAEAN